MRPNLSPGWKACNTRPDNVYQASDTTQLGQDPNWMVTEYKEIGGGVGDLTYLHIEEYMGPDEFWAYPEGIQCGKSSTSSPGVSSAEAWHIKQVQKALNKSFTEHKNYPLVEDGRWGPKTCGAIYGFQRKMAADSGVSLKAATFTALNLPGQEYETRFQVACTPYYTAPVVTTPQPAPETPPVVETPVVSSVRFPWLEVLLGTASGAGTGYAMQRTKRVRTTTGKATGAGALGGAVIGYFIGKLRG